MSRRRLERSWQKSDFSINSNLFPYEKFAVELIFLSLKSESDNTRAINLQLSGSIKHLLDCICEDVFCETECLLDLAVKVNTIPVL